MDVEVNQARWASCLGNFLQADNSYEYISAQSSASGWSQVFLSRLGKLVNSMKENGEEIVWQNLPEAEKRLQILRDRDLEIAKIALGLQMRTRITSLEQENVRLRSMERVWAMSRIRRIYFSIPRLLRGLVTKLSR